MKTFFVLSNLLALALASPLEGLLVQSQHRDSILMLDQMTSSCPISGPVSCHSVPGNPNTCCFESPGVSPLSVRAIPAECMLNRAC